MEIGNIIREYRGRKGMTQEELAQALSVTSQAVSRWEIGASYPDIAMVPGIAKVLEVSADELLGCGNFGKRDPLLEQDKPMRSYSALVKSVQGIGDSMLNQSQIDSIFDYASSAGRMSKLVLVVDDSDFMRMMLTDILGSAGHRVVQHGSGEECLEKLQADNGIRADVCVLDINMPGLNGLEVLEKIKKDYPYLKVIMLSALCTEEIVKKALELGADGFVAKPFQASSLLERI